MRAPLPFLGLLFAGVWVLGMLTEQRTRWYRSLLGRLWPDTKTKAVPELMPAGEAK